MASETSANMNLQVSTRELFIKSVVAQVILRMPLLARLFMAKKVTWTGGRYITRPVDKAEMDEMVQSYLPGDKLTTGRKTMLDNPYFRWKYVQCPVTYDVEEELQNNGGETQTLDYTKFLVAKAQRATKIKLYKMAYGASSTTTDSGADFQSAVQALTPDLTYGHITRTYNATPANDVNRWWQPAGIVDNTPLSNSSTYTPSLTTFRKMVAGVNADNPGDLLFVTGPDNFLELQGQVEAKHIYNRDGSKLAKYGFNSMMIDGVEVVQDDFLKVSKGGSGFNTKWFLFNINDWELRLHPKRSFKFSEFTWQGDKADGFDEMLARILLAGNLMCWRPSGSMYLPTVSA